MSPASALLPLMRCGWMVCMLLAGITMTPGPGLAQSIPEACVDALAADAPRWDGPPMDVFTWDGVVVSLGDLDLQPISLCRANGPLEILPPSQLIGCVLVGTAAGLIDDTLACGAFREVRLLPESGLLWIARSSAASNEVTVLTWNGNGFSRATSYTACWDDPSTPVTDAAECGR